MNADGIAIPSVSTVDGVLTRFAPRFERANRLTAAAPDYEQPEAILAEADAALGKDDVDRELRVPDASGFALALAAHRALARGDTQTAAATSCRAMTLLPNHLHVQALVARAESREEPADIRQGLFCRAPFEALETAPGGDVYFCCPAWLPKRIGNLNETSAEAIWNSPAAQEIRASIHDGSYRHCSREHCPKLTSAGLEPTASLRTARLRRLAETRATRLADGPKKVILSHDRSCNLSCPSCRTGLILARKEEQARLNAMADRVILPLLASAERVRVTASGDPFGSAHFQYVLRHLDRAGNPRLKVDLQTNGILLTPKLWEALKLEGRVDQLLVSADAARAETYAVLRRGGQFETLVENMRFFAELRRERRIGRLRLDFVVQTTNFEEMPEVLAWARALGCDGLKIQRIRNWGTYSPAQFRAQDIADPAHPRHAELLDVLREMVAEGDYAEFWGMAGALRAVRQN